MEQWAQFNALSETECTVQVDACMKEMKNVTWKQKREAASAPERHILSSLQTQMIVSPFYVGTRSRLVLDWISMERFYSLYISHYNTVVQDKAWSLGNAFQI